jgi:hypothetical protein
MEIRVRTLTGKEIELDIESDYKVRSLTIFARPGPAKLRPIANPMANLLHK